MIPGRPAIVESILALARTLHTSVVAEGVETDRQARELERLGCPHAQGYLLLSPPSGSVSPGFACRAAASRIGASSSCSDHSSLADRWMSRAHLPPSPQPARRERET